MNYWSNKDKLRLAAMQHTEKVGRIYGTNILVSANAIKELTPNHVPFDFKYDKDPVVVVRDISTTDAIFECGAHERIAVLNFASFKNPGGAFLSGSSAQEECLCHESTLYNCLIKKIAWYKENSRQLNKGLYCCRGLLVPDVIFSRPGGRGVDKIRACDVYTVAAPNAGAARRNRVGEDAISRALEERIQFVMDKIYLEPPYDTVILGAFGCGVFKNDSFVVASIFKEKIYNHCNSDKIVFAVIGCDNLRHFQRVFSE